MRAWLIALMVGMAAMSSQPAVAASWGYAPGLQGQGQRGPAQHDQREMRRERRVTPERDERPRHRLTDDERRDLRRDIDQADREIYRRDRRR
ncbi:MAG: hypothetical protein AABZ67_10105 [Pseudomonadota bacterium]